MNQSFLLKLFLLVTALVITADSFGRRRYNSWQAYLSYANAKKIALSPGKVYCATEGGIMYYDVHDNSINRFSETSGLSDFGIQTIAYSEENSVLVVAYTNCNIDLVYASGVINLSDIKRKQITGKSINAITLIGNEVYLSCSFGIVVLNLERQEVKDTYIIGPGGTYLSVNDVEADSEYLYAATNNGIFRARRDADNLLDYTNWKRVENIPRSSGKFNYLAYHSGKLIANYTPEAWAEDQMFVLNGDVWEPYLPYIRFAFDIQRNGSFLTIAGRESVFIIDENHNIVRTISHYLIDDKEVSPITPYSAAIAPNGTIWIADYYQSMMKVTGNIFEQVKIAGPSDNIIFSLQQLGNNLWVTPGDKAGWQFPRFQRLENKQWTNFSRTEYPEMDGTFNILSVAVNPLNENHFYVGSWGGGLLEFKNDQFVHRYTNLNSPLETALPGEPAAPYVRIGGMDFDSEGNLWMTNSEVENVLVRLAPDGKWESFSLPEIANRFSIGQLLVTQNDDKWILAPRGNDAYVVDKTGARKKRLLVTSYFNNGQQEIINRMNDVYSIVEDTKGSIWLGTSMGVAVYNNARRIWDTEPFYAIQPALNLGDGYYHPLLETETVTAIAVDGANRKWLGTSNSGLYLVSENGDKELLHFTSENSPLLSNSITSLAIDPYTGEVFIGTAAGLISYQGDAIEGRRSFENVYVFPNPVRENWTGPVTITGLVENTDVKITDISGNLVFQGNSLGGQTVWDGRNLNGNRVRTGVYLVFCADRNGEETHIEKLLFIN